MQITIPDDALALAKTQAEAAGFENVGDYVANLIRRHGVAKKNGLSPSDAIKDLRELRRELPKLSTGEIVDLVHDARTDLR